MPNKPPKPKKTSKPRTEGIRFEQAVKKSFQKKKPAGRMRWFAIRSIYLFGKKADGTNVYEERIVCFRAESAGDAHVKAELESEKYASDNGFDVFTERDGYEQDGEPLIDGYELWSMLYESRLPVAKFYATRYLNYDYHPEF